MSGYGPQERNQATSDCHYVSPAREPLDAHVLAVIIDQAMHKQRYLGESHLLGEMAAGGWYVKIDGETDLVIPGSLGMISVGARTALDGTVEDVEGAIRAFAIASLNS